MSAPTPTLINGSVGVASVSMGTNNLYDCVLGSWRATAVKKYFDQITFCSGGWRSNVGGIKAIDVICSGYLSHGNAISDPLVNFGTVTGGVACIFQADTNCQLTGNFFIDPGFGVVAGAASEAVYNCQSVGALRNHLEHEHLMTPRIFLGVPTYDGRLTSRAAQTIYGESTHSPKMVLAASSSLLCQTFNALWCAALNRRRDGITHFAMLHADVEPEGDWIDVLIGEMEAHQADVISAVVPLKSNAGLTSTAVESADPWRPRRLTLTELSDLPETFSAAEVPWANGRPLLVNTGCFVCRFTGEWVERACFHIEDAIVRNAQGDFEPRVFPEDWGFSRWAHGEKLKVVATRKVRLTHVGIAPFPNYGVWGQETDIAVV